MFCTRCGKPLEEGASLCASCGAAVTAPSGSAPQAAKPVKEKKAPKPARKQSAAARAGSIFLSFLLCLALVFTCAVTLLRAALSGDDLAARVKRIDLTEVTLQVEGEGETPLADYLYTVAQTYELDLKRRDINELLDHKLVREFEDVVLARYQGYVLGSTSKTKGTTSDMVVDFIRDHEREINQLLLEKSGTTVTFHYDDIQDQLDEYLDSAADTAGDLLAPGAKNTSGPKILSTARTLLSPVILILGWVVCALLALGLILLCRHTPTALLLYLGIPVLIAGVVFGLLGLFILLAPTVLSLEGPAALLAGGDALLGGVCDRSLIAGGIMLGVGIVAVVVRVILGKVRKARQTGAPVAA